MQIELQCDFIHRLFAVEYCYHCAVRG
eukprot:COSAG06_NODE_59021_length_275_cov_0.880682_1_plen_26_part_10